MKKTIIIFILTLCAFASDIDVVASTNNIASIAKAVGRNHVKINVIVKARQNPHSIQILPSYMLKISRADIYLQVGLKLDYWSQQLIDGSRNSSITVVNCSNDIIPIDKPKGQVNPSKGHLHPDGNPHYTLDPNNARIVAKTVLAAFIEKDPDNASDYNANYVKFLSELDLFTKSLKNTFLKKDIITYHSTFNYLTRFLKLSIRSTIEPLPGVSPTPSHLNKLIKLITKKSIPLIIQENYNSEKASHFLMQNTKIKTLVVSPFTSAVTSNSYISFLKNIIKKIDDVL